MHSIPAFLKINEDCYRENQGLYFEEFQLNVTVQHQPGRTITDTDNTWITLLSLNRHPIHFNQKYAEEKNEFGNVLVNSTVTFSIINGMTVEWLSAKAVANLGWDKVRLINPVFVGDTLYAESKILSKRESRSRPHQGIVTINTVGKNQNNAEVITMERSFLVPKRIIS